MTEDNKENNKPTNQQIEKAKKLLGLAEGVKLVPEKRIEPFGIVSRLAGCLQCYQWECYAEYNLRLQGRALGNAPSRTIS